MRSISTLFFALSLVTQVAFASVNEKLSYFNGDLEALVIGPTELTVRGPNAFTVKITDATGAPATTIIAKYVTATSNMTNMEMGSIKAVVTDVLDTAGLPQGVIKIVPTFSMAGPWELKIKIRTTAGSEMNSVRFDVAR
jgi:hypothetical protein